MQNIFFKLIILFFFVSSHVNAQELKSEQFAHLHQKVDISVHENKVFKLSASIRKDIIGRNQSAFLYLTIAEKEESDELLFYGDTQKQPISEQWETYVIQGKVGPKATSLSFGFVCSGNGKIFFDDFKLEVQNADGNWEGIPTLNPDFEKNHENKEPVWGNEKINFIRNFSATITEENPRTGTYCLVVEGKDVYGQNDDKGGFVAVNGVKLYYEIYGEGEPLLLLHGSGQSINSFVSQIDFFSKHYKVIALDSRGRGRSTDNDDELTYVNQAKDVKEFLDELQLDSVDIIGWSDGGIIGLIMAMKYPEKVKKLVAMAANIHPDGLLAERLQLHRETVKKLEMDEKNINTINYKTTKQLIDYPQLEFDDLKSITSPTLIMAGDHDVIRDIHTVKIFQAIPNANLAIFPGETHWFPALNSKLFNSTVFDFLQKEFKNTNRY